MTLLHVGRATRNELLDQHAGALLLFVSFRPLGSAEDDDTAVLE
jgi:hypothetical protein